MYQVCGNENKQTTSQNHDDVIKWKYFPRYWPFVRGIHRSPVNSPHKGQWRRALMLSFICARINDWVNNGEAGDLRRHRAHYDVIVMVKDILTDRRSPCCTDGDCKIAIIRPMRQSTSPLRFCGNPINVMANVLVCQRKLYRQLSLCGITWKHWMRKQLSGIFCRVSVLDVNYFLHGRFLEYVGLYVIWWPISRSEDSGNIWGVLCQKKVSRAGTSKCIPQYLWDVITYPCPWYLLLGQHSWFILNLIIITKSRSSYSIVYVSAKNHKFDVCFNIWYIIML